MTLDSILAEAAAKGLRLNQLHEFDDGVWQSNFRCPEANAPIGKGSTALDALSAAFEHALPLARCVKAPEADPLADMLS